MRFEFIRRWATALLLVGVLVAPAQAAGLSAKKISRISDLASAAIESGRLPGLGVAVAVAEDGRIWSAGFGKADLEQNVRATPQSMFRTASVGKWFTATAALRLVEQGKLDLDAPIQQYCPQFPAKEWPVTSREILSHMSGIRHNFGQNGEKPTTDAEKAALEREVQRERATQYVRYTDVVAPLDAFKNDPLLFKPGTDVRYSSLGYRVLGCVLQGAAHAPYRQLMRDLVFTPAGMTSITEDDALAIVPGRVAGYSKAADGRFQRAEFRDVSENLPAGGYLATASDLVRFVLAFEAGKLVKPDTRDLMLAHPKLVDGSPAPNPFGTPGYYYGMGIMVDPAAPQPAWFHTGGQSGASALMFWFPKSRIAVALTTNIDGSAVRENLARKIEAIAAAN